MRVCLPVLLILSITLVNRVLGADERNALFDSAQSHWRLGEDNQTAKHPLKPNGTIELNVPAEGDAAVAHAKVAKMKQGYFDAGKSLNISGDQCTVYLRARDPRGKWGTALFAKRGSHETINFNLYSGLSLIGFELHTETGGFVGVTFPISKINPTAWHDLIGRYDGKTVELICDGNVMANARWHGGNLTQSQEPLLIGAETDAGTIVRLFTGEMEEAAIWPQALSHNEIARLVRRDTVISGSEIAEPYVSPIHFRPAVGVLADTIPFYWKGAYHIFYLRGNIGKVPWEHIVSTDLVHWKELPTALVPDGNPNGPDGEHMYTGSVYEWNGTFHIFYTGWNPRNPAGREFIMHATSPDLIKWTKHPKDIIAPDGIQYANHKDRDFRDAFVFWNDESKEHWMILCANSLHGGGPGVAISKDLKQWSQAPALKAPNQECPDLFKIDDTWYLLGGNTYSFSKDLRGEFKAPPVQNVIDRPGVYAGKRMFDGRRHIWTGWVWDSNTGHDGGGAIWGGTQCLPRELYAGPDGQLYQRPVDEVTAVFKHTTLQIAAPCNITMGSLPVPDHYMLQCNLQLDPQAIFTITMRQQANGADGYHFVLRPKTQEAELNGPGFCYKRRCTLDTNKPIKFQAFVQGTILECFVNDQFAYTCRAYNFPKGAIGLKVEDGKAKVLELTVKTHDAEGTR
jgi:sucrose-6-phosphate hydrolase SacC (GH32 family)